MAMVDHLPYTGRGLHAIGARVPPPPPPPPLPQRPQTGALGADSVLPRRRPAAFPIVWRQGTTDRDLIAKMNDGHHRHRTSPPVLA